MIDFNGRFLFIVQTNLENHFRFQLENRKKNKFNAPSRKRSLHLDHFSFGVSWSIFDVDEPLGDPSLSTTLSSFSDETKETLYLDVQMRRLFIDRQAVTLLGSENSTVGDQRGKVLNSSSDRIERRGEIDDLTPISADCNVWSHRFSTIGSIFSSEHELTMNLLN